ncbi:hypothetical protein B2J93_2576 [Marssonina coronariae]|uniref:MYB DNA-binding domain-containing protein n=1 Tax=Diplocarpon coronariae TaxID=2795749 RepID=A0A218YZZ6_9HELO|nr:hypothetical protein B2J93_2576 [Marssonina coronariae]
MIYASHDSSLQVLRYRNAVLVGSGAIVSRPNAGAKCAKVTSWFQFSDLSISISAVKTFFRTLLVASLLDQTDTLLAVSLKTFVPDVVYSRPATVTVDISLLLKAPDSNESASSAPPSHRHHTRSISVPSTSGYSEPSPYAHTNIGAGGKRSMPPHPAESPAKKQSKWSPEEDALIIDLRGGGMKWEDISKRLPGRSAISCRLHYQNYLERRSEWDEERKNKLARLYERFKPEMWSKVAEEMAVPWRAAEAMHWQLGEADMARRAGVVPFSLSSVSTDVTPLNTGHRSSPSRGHSHNHSQTGMMGSGPGPGPPPARYGRPPTAHSSSSSKGPGAGPGRTAAARRESTPRSVPPASPSDGMALAGLGGAGRAMGTRGGSQMLPSVAELTTGVSPYSTPAFAMPMPMGGGYHSPGPMLPSIGMVGGNLPEGKRRASPDMGPRETSRRRQ